MNEKQPTTEQPIEAPLEEVQGNEPQPVEPQVPDPRRRLRELLAIRDSERTDALWDEIIGLEIQLAPGNRASTPQADSDHAQQPSGQRDPRRRQEPASGTKSGKHGQAHRPRHKRPRP